MSGNFQNLYQGRSLCCNVLQRFPSDLACHAQTSPFQWAKMAPRCNCAARIPGRMLIPWGEGVIFGGSIVVDPLGVWLGTIGGQGKLPPFRS